MIRRQLAVLAALTALAAPRADAAIRITEWMYSGNPGEFVELTNAGGPAVDMTDWSFADEATSAGAVSLSAFGIVLPGESVIFTEAAEATFRTAWALDASVKIIGGVTTNLGRNDHIKIYDASSTLIDQLDFGDASTPGTGPRTENRSGNPLTLAALNANDPAQWTLASVGDVYGSYNSTAGTTGNPGTFALIPEPAALTLAAVGLAALAVRRRSLR